MHSFHPTKEMWGHLAIYREWVISKIIKAHALVLLTCARLRPRHEYQHRSGFQHQHMITVVLNATLWLLHHTGSCAFIFCSPGTFLGKCAGSIDSELCYSHATMFISAINLSIMQSDPNRSNVLLLIMYVVEQVFRSDRRIRILFCTDLVHKRKLLHRAHITMIHLDWCTPYDPRKD